MFQTRIPRIILLLIMWAQCSGQPSSLSPGEKCWAITHPFAALKVRLTGKRCKALYALALQKLPQPDFSYGGRGDAFRHVFYMAAFAQRVKPKKLRKLGLAHERANYRAFISSRDEMGERPDSLGSVMDLLNNELGFELGLQYRSLSLEALSDKVLEAIHNGRASILKRKKNGIYIDCAGHDINLKEFAGKWYVPKCLVPSNEPYMD